MATKNRRKIAVIISFSGKVRDRKRLAQNILQTLKRECEMGDAISHSAVEGHPREITVRVTRKAIATCHLEGPEPAASS